MAKQQEALSNDSEVVTEPDDGFTAEERQQFEEMQKDSGATQESTLVPDAPEAGKEGEKPDAAKAAPDAAAVAAGDAADEAGDDEGDDKPDAADPNAKLPRRVSYKKFARTEAEAKELKAKLAERDAGYARLDERLKIINEALATRPGEAAADAEAKDDDPEPNKEEDIFGHNAWLSRQLQRTNERLAKFEEGQQTTAQENALANTYRADAATFAQAEPNFVPAYQFLMQSRTIELAEYFFGKDVTVEGATLTPQEILKIKQTVAEEENALVAQAIQQRKSPAARVFALAKARGFRPQAAAAADAGKTTADAAAAAAAGKEKANGAANGADKAAPGSLATGSDAKGSVTEEIARIKNGQDAALSLSNGGGSPTNPLTPERLANMPQEEFESMVESMSPAEWKRVASGG